MAVAIRVPPFNQRPIFYLWSSNWPHFPPRGCFLEGKSPYSLKIQVCPKKGISPTILLWGWDRDHIGSIKPTLGKGMDPEGFHENPGDPNLASKVS